MTRMFVFAWLVLSVACSKNEQPVEQPRFTKLQLKALTEDSLLLQVVANEDLLTNALSAPGSKRVTVFFKDRTHRIRVTDLYSKLLLVDTMINYRDGEENFISFLQPVAGGPMKWVGPPVNEPAPPASHIKVSLVFDHTLRQTDNTPFDSLKIVAETSKNGDRYNTTDSFVLKRGDISPYITSHNEREPRLKIYKRETDWVKIADVNAAEFFKTNNNSFGIYALSEIRFGIASLTKLY